MVKSLEIVIPVKTGIQAKTNCFFIVSGKALSSLFARLFFLFWIPAFAGMTNGMERE